MKICRRLSGAIKKGYVPLKLNKNDYGNAMKSTNFCRQALRFMSYDLNTSTDGLFERKLKPLSAYNFE